MMDGKNQIPKNQARGDTLRPLFHSYLGLLYIYPALPSLIQLMASQFHKHILQVGGANQQSGFVFKSR